MNITKVSPEFATDLIGLINSLKGCAELEDIRFVRGYTNQRIESPVSGFTAAVIVLETKLKESYLGGDIGENIKGDIYSAGAEIRLYAPRNENGSGLSHLAAIMLDRLKDVKSDCALSGFNAGQIEFDANLNAIFRRIGFELELPVFGEECDE